jgi:hypothetical protein
MTLRNQRQIVVFVAFGKLLAIATWLMADGR